MPASWLSWPSSGRDAPSDEVQERLKNLWRLSTSEGQRWELEQLAKAVGPPPPRDTYGLEAAVDDVNDAIYDLRRIVDKLQKA